MSLAISPLDGRYQQKLSIISLYFSEKALMKYRCLIELKYLLALNDLDIFPSFTEAELSNIQDAINTFHDDDYTAIKDIEATINHDVKACEIFLRGKLQLNRPEMIHFGLTSEDINNLAYSCMMKAFKEEFHEVIVKEMITKLIAMAKQAIDIPFPTRTHGQPASPSTAGKELAVFIERLYRQYSQLTLCSLYGKLNGATGNFSALYAACEHIDWISFSQKFVESLGLKNNQSTTQIEDHDSWSEYFSITQRINTIILDMNTDLWTYISNNWIKQKAKKEEVGSSTMPHKVNPINFENSEGNIIVANTLLQMLATRLMQSRMQRDLSDSTIERNIGVAFAHSVLAYKECLRGLDKLEFNRDELQQALDDHPEILAEPIQTILKMHGISDAYEQLKDVSRGKDLGEKGLQTFIESLSIHEQVKQQLLDLKPSRYLGLAKAVAHKTIDKVEKYLES